MIKIKDDHRDPEAQTAVVSPRRKAFWQRRWTLGFLMIVIAGAALVCAVLKPFAETTESSGEVIGISFKLQETRSPDGKIVMGLAPKMTVTKKAANGGAP